MATSCRTEKVVKSSPTDDASYDTSLPEDFSAFYDRFHTDSAFQMAHINFPLEGKKALEEGGSEPYTYRQEEWKLHKPYNDYEGTYQRSFTSIGNMVTETIRATQGSFRMIRRFAKLSGEWTLIYYEPMGMY